MASDDCPSFFCIPQPTVGIRHGQNSGAGSRGGGATGSVWQSDNWRRVGEDSTSPVPLLRLLTAFLANADDSEPMSSRNGRSGLTDSVAPIESTSHAWRDTEPPPGPLSLAAQ